MLKLKKQYPLTPPPRERVAYCILDNILPFEKKNFESLVNELPYPALTLTYPITLKAYQWLERKKIIKDIMWEEIFKKKHPNFSAISFSVFDFASMLRVKGIHEPLNVIKDIIIQDLDNSLANSKKYPRDYAIKILENVDLKCNHTILELVIKHGCNPRLIIFLLQQDSNLLSTKNLTKITEILQQIKSEDIGLLRRLLQSDFFIRNKDKRKAILAAANPIEMVSYVYKICINNNSPSDFTKEVIDLYIENITGLYSTSQTVRCFFYALFSNSLPSLKEIVAEAALRTTNQDVITMMLTYDLKVFDCYLNILTSHDICQVTKWINKVKKEAQLAKSKIALFTPQFKNLLEADSQEHQETGFESCLDITRII